jgi:hypothetical protein
MTSAFRNIAESVFETNAWVAFVSLCVLSLLTLVFQQFFILTDDVYYNSLGEQLAYDRIETILDSQKKYRWLAYALSPLLLVIQILLITICLNIGTLLREDKISFKKLFSIVTKVLIIPFFFKFVMVCMTYFFYDIKSFNDLANVFSFSLINFFDATSVPAWLQYPLAMVNLVEILFWLLLAYGIRSLLNMDFSRCISFVSYTYGIGLVMWMLFMVFLQVSLS